jgi:hypothetical protein
MIRPLMTGLAMSEAAKRPSRMVEAAGAELYIHVIAKLVMARDFWGERLVEKNLDASPFSSDVRTTSTSTISGREHATEEPAHDRPSTLLGEDDGEERTGRQRRPLGVLLLLEPVRLSRVDRH